MGIHRDDTPTRRQSAQAETPAARDADDPAVHLVSSFSAFFWRTIWAQASRYPTREASTNSPNSFGPSPISLRALASALPIQQAASPSARSSDILFRVRLPWRR